MEIDLAKLELPFRSKPLLIGGMAMEYYGLRPASGHIELIVAREDYVALARRYPQSIRDNWGDLGVCVLGFELWRSFCLFTYTDLLPGAVDVGEHLVISLEKLLLLKALAMKEETELRDVELIVGKLHYDKYAPWWRALPEDRRATYQAVDDR